MAKIETLTDGFTSSTVGAQWWVQTPPSPGASSLTVGNEYLKIVQATQGYALNSDANYDFTNSQVTFYGVNGAFIFSATGLTLSNDGTTVKFSDDGYTTTFGTMSYNAQVMAHFRIRCTSTVAYAEYSPDGSGWSLIASATTTIPTNSGLTIQVGKTSSTLYVDGVNTASTNRYLVATGNWSNSAKWSAWSGGAGGAGVPTINNTVYIDANFTVTLDTDIVVDYISQTNGTLTCGPYNVTANYYGDGNSSSAKTLNMGSGTWTLTNGVAGVVFGKNNANTTVNAQSSLLILNIFGGQYWAYPIGANPLGAGFTLNDVIFNIGTTAGGTNIGILGSPTFRLLDIRSANSAAHTVVFDDDAVPTIEKFIAIGSSTSNRLLLTNQTPGHFGYIEQSASGTVYGQNVNNGAFGGPAGGANDKLYLGSNSIVSNGAGSGWLLQDPPKISTLVDPLTTSPGSNSNWSLPTLSGGNTTPTLVGVGKDGGGYKFNSGGGYWSLLRSTDTYDLVDSSVIFEVNDRTTSKFALLSSLLYTNSSGDPRPNAVESAGAAGSNKLQYQVFGAGRSNSGTISSSTSGVSEFIKVAVSAGGVMTWSLWEGGTFVQKGSYTIPAADLPLYRSRRIDIHGSGDGVIGSINPELVVDIDVNSASSSVSISTPSISKTASLSAQGHGVSTSMSTPNIQSVIVLDTDSIGTSTSMSEPSMVLNMDVDAMSIIPAILATAVQIGYPTSDISADNIYAIGSMSEGEYGIATINNNQIYEVVEQDAI